MTRIALALTWLLHWLPFGVLSRLGAVVGAIAHLLARERRRVALINVERCFPELDETARRHLVREHFIRLGRVYLEITAVWWGAPERIRRLIVVDGAELFTQVARGKTPVILLAPHFVGMEFAGALVALEMNAATFYSRQSNPLLDQFISSRRRRFRPTRLISRQDGVKPAIKALKDGVPLFFPGDLDFGPRDAVFAPFFGVMAATITALPRLSRLTDAEVVALVVEQGPSGKPYRMRVSRPFTGFPTGDVQSDIARMNRFIEAEARRMPAQYYWVHKRFKTRPAGEPSFYEKNAD
jgi:Kdo2-lipid IVA lauroyltransferase/acyltransferase